MKSSRFVEIARVCAGRLLAVLPERLLGLILPPALRFRPRDIVPPPTLSGERRLIIAPLNYAGQAYEWARAIERGDDRFAVQNAMVRTRADFRHASDYAIPVGVYAASGRWHREWSEHVIGTATHYIVEGLKPPLGLILAESLESQVSELQQAGIQVAMLCHGSDIRLPSRHAAEEPDSPFRDGSDAITLRLESVVTRNLALLRNLGLPTFVSTPDLLLDVPHATWVPVVVSAEQWETRSEPLERRVPVVIHAPSAGRIKGSDLVDETMRKLQDEGAVEYRRLSGIPHAEMVREYTQADIVLDQFRLGSYGVAACEAMAAGRVVVGHVNDHVANIVRRDTGLDIPIIRARHSELETVIRHAIADRDVARQQARLGPEFVRAVHDGRRSASAFASFLS